MSSILGERLLNVFINGGPLDTGLAYDTRYLLQLRPETRGVEGYRWTPEVVVGPTSGRRCRVWRWRGES